VPCQKFAFFPPPMLSLNGDGTYLILRKKHLISRCYENTHHTASERRRRERERWGITHAHKCVFLGCAAALGLLLPPHCPFSCGYFERRDSCCVDFSGGRDCCCFLIFSAARLVQYNSLLKANTVLLYARRVVVARRRHRFALTGRPKYCLRRGFELRPRFD
jgi:hypothetical protein